MYKTPAELDELSPDERKVHKRQEQNLVFGEDCPRDSKGRPIEQGIGSASHPTENSLNALHGAIRQGLIEDPDGKIYAAEKKRLDDYRAKHPVPVEVD